MLGSMEWTIDALIRDARHFTHTWSSNWYSSDEVVNRVKAELHKEYSSSSCIPIQNNRGSIKCKIGPAKGQAQHAKADNCYRILELWQDVQNHHSQWTVISAWWVSSPRVNTLLSITWMLCLGSSGFGVRAYPGGSRRSNIRCCCMYA